MVDVHERRSSRQRELRAVGRAEVDRDDEVARARRRLTRVAIGPRQEARVLGHPVGAVERDALSEAVERETERDAGADGVGVGVAVRDDRDGLRASEGVDDLLHEGSSRSRACRNSVAMRAARSAVWSETNVRSGT